MYDEPNGQFPCYKCKYRQYASIYDEYWCSHTPAPEGIEEQLIVDRWGTCEYWERDDWYE